MSPSSFRAAVSLGVFCLLSPPLSAQSTTPGPSLPAKKAARDNLAKFDKGDPGWKVRMEALVSLVRAGPDAFPVVVEALHKGSPSTRAFAAQALVFIADPGARPALEKAVSDEDKLVRIYAINALSMFGRLEPSERYRQAREQDNWAVRRHMAFALERDDTPDPAALRKTLARYDLAKMDSARLGEVAPDFSLTDVLGRTEQLGRYRDKKAVVLLFLTIA
jgi:HEAT repeats